MRVFDSHAHYDDEKFEMDRDNIIQEIHRSGVEKIISAGYSLEASKKAIELAKKYNFLYATCGISPNDIEGIEIEDLEQIRTLAKENKNFVGATIGRPIVVAIGEIGLDYYWNKENKEKQKDIFIRQIEIANELDLPIVIHTREAIMDTIDILKNKITCNKKGVFHCCPLNIELVKEALKLGFYISMAGPITFKNSKNADEIIKYVPLDKILIETDSPYLAPEPVRGTRNNSSNLKYIVQKIANAKAITEEEVEIATYNNTCRLFEID